MCLDGHVQPVIKMITGNQFDYIYGYAINHQNMPLVVLNSIKGRQSFRERGALEKNSLEKFCSRCKEIVGVRIGIPSRVVRTSSAQNGRVFGRPVSSLLTPLA